MKFIKISLILILPVLCLPVTACRASAAQNAGTPGVFAKCREYNDHFADVFPSEWYYLYVKNAYEAGIIDGKKDNEYGPDRPVTIAEVIKIAACLHKIYNYGNSSFDLHNEWYIEYVDYAKTNQIIITDYGDYGKPALRYEAAEIISRTLPSENLKNINDLTDGDIPDVKMSDSYGSAVYLLYGAGILTGSDKYGNFYADTPVNRSEMAAIVNRLVDPAIRLTYNPTVVIEYNYMLSDKPLTFEYNDLFFSQPGNILNGDLAKASIALSAAALGSRDHGGSENIINAFEAMGYKVIAQNNYDSKSTDDKNDFAAYTIASRKILLNKNEYTVYGLIIRGTMEISEWYSNFDIGETENAPHKGFTNAAGNIYKTLDKYITTDKEKTILWLSGHSRGAAVTNIIAAILNRNEKYAKKDNIYAYTFGCPAVTTEPYICDNIFNFNNPGDILAHIPFTLWGYGVNGIEIHLSTEDSVLEEMKKNFMEITDGIPYLGGYDTEEFSELVSAWCPTKESFYKAGSGGISPYECFVSVISLGNGDAGLLQAASVLFRYDYSPEGIKVALYLTQNLLPIYHSHIYELYISWLESIY